MLDIDTGKASHEVQGRLESCNVRRRQPTTYHKRIPRRCLSGRHLFKTLRTKTYQYSKETTFGGHGFPVLLYTSHQACTIVLMQLHRYSLCHTYVRMGRWPQIKSVQCPYLKVVTHDGRRFPLTSTLKAAGWRAERAGGETVGSSEVVGCCLKRGCDHKVRLQSEPLSRIVEVAKVALVGLKACKRARARSRA